MQLRPPQEVEGGVPHRVGRQRDLLLELLQAVPELSSSARQKNPNITTFFLAHMFPQHSLMTEKPVVFVVYPPPPSSLKNKTIIITCFSPARCELT